ncbi:ModD protein [Nitrospirillum sp. BR 11164]|uniref:ModD protein n=1 Tax=Nitrospirillum sp. BR 11164 TaxID=3104324 RepID=UPI002AFFABC7|nr:ModD protein [Nitrospirillum sp. BR 11164]MEA1651216.1 ModD protein [Nitrospirillum sp. BR 11164]
MDADGDTQAWRLSDAEIERLVEEDLRFGDLTTRALGIGARPGRMTFAARPALVLSGVDEAARLLMRLGATVPFAAEAGGTYAPGAPLLTAEGPATALHAGWKVAQTVMEWASGIATLTHDIVAAAQAVKPGIPVLCTRKSVPYTRHLSLKAVIAGGGEVHRLGLSDTLLVFPEHRAFLGDDLAMAIAILKRRVPERAVMVEVTSEAEAMAAAAARADVIQLEKFPPMRWRLWCAASPSTATAAPSLPRLVASTPATPRLMPPPARIRWSPPPHSMPRRRTSRSVSPRHEYFLSLFNLPAELMIVRVLKINSLAPAFRTCETNYRQLVIRFTTTDTGCRMVRPQTRGDVRCL